VRVPPSYWSAATPARHLYSSQVTLRSKVIMPAHGCAKFSCFFGGKRHRGTFLSHADQSSPLFATIIYARICWRLGGNGVRPIYGLSEPYFLHGEALPVNYIPHFQEYGITETPYAYSLTQITKNTART
jgi:hypothetical protein